VLGYSPSSGLSYTDGGLRLCSFRLNVTRLHSDWLIARKEYTTALRFDQLREVLLEQNSVLQGFAEGNILFAPTCTFDRSFHHQEIDPTLCPP